MDIPQIQEELSEIRQAFDAARARMWQAQQGMALNPISAKTDIELAVENIKRNLPRLTTLLKEMENGN